MLLIGMKQHSYCVLELFTDKVEIKTKTMLSG